MKLDFQKKTGKMKWRRKRSGQDLKKKVDCNEFAVKKEKIILYQQEFQIPELWLLAPQGGSELKTLMKC